MTHKSLNDWKFRVSCRPTNLSDRILTTLDVGPKLLVAKDYRSVDGWKNQYKLYRAVSCVLENMRRYVLAKNSGFSQYGIGVVIPQSAWYYTGRAFGLSKCKQAVKVLVAAGFVQPVNKPWVSYGSSGGGYPKKGIASVYAPSEKLCALIQELSQDLAEVTSSESESAPLSFGDVVLREKLCNGRSRELARNTRIGIESLYKGALTKINTVAATFQWSWASPYSGLTPFLKAFGDVAESGNIVLPPDWFVYSRVFNKNYASGGRFYADFVSMIESQYREFLFVDGKPTVELDYGAMHIQMSYALSGYEYCEDPYKIECPEVEVILGKSLLRLLIKRSLLIMINSKSDKDLARAISNAWTKKVRPKQQKLNLFKKKLGLKTEGEIRFSPSFAQIKAVVDKLKVKHARIKHMFESNAGVRLQFIDSMIAEDILLRFRDKNKPILCIHDGFRVRAEDEGLLRSVMVSSYKKVLGSQFSIAVKKVEPVTPFLKEVA